MLKLHVRKPFLLAALLSAVVAVALFSFSSASEPNGGGDYDYDGIYDEVDNCMYIYNPMQLDRDGDEIGDVCDGEWFNQEQYGTLYPKKEEFVLCYFSYMEEPFMGDDDGPPPEGEPICETITVDGDVLFYGIGSEGDYVYFDVVTQEGLPLTGYSEMFGDVELELGGEGYYYEKFNGLDFPADAEISYHNWVLWADARTTCALDHPQEICDSEFPPDLKFPIYLYDTKYEYGIIKAFPPLYENPLCTGLPYPGEGGFNPMELGAEPPFPLMGEFVLFFNCDEFGTPVLSTPATPDIATYLPTGSRSFTDLNTEVELHLDPVIPQFAPDYFFKLTGLSDQIYTQATSSFFGPELDTIETEIVEMDLMGAITDRPVGPDMDVTMHLITEDHPLWAYVGAYQNPFYEGYNHGIEFYLFDIVKVLMTYFGPGYLDFFTETFPMVGEQSLYVYFEADLQDDGSIETIVPWDAQGENVLPVIMSAYPGKKGVPPYYTTYCTYQNSYILELFSNYGYDVFGPEFMDYFSTNMPNIPMYRVMQDGIFTPMQIHIWDMELMCIELREEELCDGVDNDFDGLVDEGPYNNIDGWAVKHLYDFEDEAYGFMADDDDDDSGDQDYAYHSSQTSSPPDSTPGALGDSEFWHDPWICEGMPPPTFHIYTESENGWEEVDYKHYELYMENGEFDLSEYLPDVDGEYKVKIEHVGEYSAFVDVVSLGGNAPLSAILNNDDITEQVSKLDKNLASVGGKSFVAEFNATDNKVLSLTAREETEQSLAVNNPILLPGTGDQYYSHNLGDNTELENMVRPTSGHEPGYIYTSVSNDSKNLYLNVDVTSDNTNDDGTDFVEVLIGEKSFKVTDLDTTYGELVFASSANADYPHNVAKISIPLSELNARGSVEFKLNVYGTFGAAEEHYCQIAHSDGPDNYYPGDYRYWAMTDDTYSWNYNTQRFEFYVNDDFEPGDMLRVHWEGRALGSPTTATVYIWNESIDEWEFLGSHGSSDDLVIEGMVSPENYIYDGYVNVLVQGDIYDDYLVYNNDNNYGKADLLAVLIGDDDDDEPWYDSEMLYTDYVKLEIVEEMAGCTETRSAPRRPSDDDDDDDDDGGGVAAPEIHEAADAPTSCLSYNDDRLIAYNDNPDVWTKPYVDFLSKLFIEGNPNHYVLSGFGIIDNPDEATGTLIKPGKLTQRYQAVKMALNTQCIPPYTTEERLAIEGGKTFGDFARDADVGYVSTAALSKEDLTEALNWMYKALDLGIVEGRQDPITALFNAEPDKNTTRAEILKVFLNAADYDTKNSFMYSAEELQEFATIYKVEVADLTPDQILNAALNKWRNYYYDVSPNAWYAEYIPMVVKNKIVADVCVPMHITKVSSFDPGNEMLVRTIAAGYECDDLADPARFAFPDKPATRGEVFALGARILYIVSGMDKVNVYSGFNMLDPDFVLLIKDLFEGSERDEFLLGVIEKMATKLGIYLNAG